MIQELISTSAPRCLNGNAGFGIVAQTVGMAPNVSQAVNALSAYTHVAPPGSPQNPVVYMHAIRRTGGMMRHVVSRIADCGNDYSGRSNRIAHHWIVEATDTLSLPGGPATLILQDIFRSGWNEKPAELPPKQLSAPDVSANQCPTWERLTGDAGWGKVVAERAAKGVPISIVFTPECSGEHLRALLSEALVLLPSATRWKVTFSTYYMKSQEASGDKIQIKCFLADSEASQFVRQSPNTLVIDLRQPLGPAPAVQLPEASSRHDRLTRKIDKQPSKGQQDWDIPMTPTTPETIAVPMKQPWIRQNWKVCLASCIAVVLCVGMIGTTIRSLQSERNELLSKLSEHEMFLSELPGLFGLSEFPEQDTSSDGLEEGNDEFTKLKKGVTEVLESRETILKSKHTGDIEAINAQFGEERKKLINERDAARIDADDFVQKEKNRKADAAKRQNTVDRLERLPDIWEGLALSRNNAPVPNILQLGFPIKDVKIDYVPFVKLETPVKFSQLPTQHKGYRIIVENVEVIEIEESVDMSLLGTQTSKLGTQTSKKKEKTPSDRHWTFFASSSEDEQIQIAVLSHTDEEIQFHYDPAVLPDGLNADDWNWLRNRILLSKLRITVGNILPREITLWAPQEVNASNAPWVAINHPSQIVLRIVQSSPFGSTSIETPKNINDALQTGGGLLQRDDMRNYLRWYRGNTSLYLVHPDTKEELLLMTR